VRRIGAAFFLGDTAFLSDPKFRALARRLQDPDDFNSAVGAYWIALAAARRNGKPTLDLDTETGSRFLDDLRAVQLLDDEGFPARPFDEWAPRPQQSIAGAARAAQGRRDEKGRLLPSDTSALDALDKLDQPSTLLPSTQLSTEDDEGARAPERLSASERQVLIVACSECGASAGDPCRGVRATRNGDPWQRWAVHRPRWEMAQAVEPVDDDLWELYRGLTRAVSLKPAALDWLDKIESAYGVQSAAKVLREEHGKDGNPGTLLSRVNGRLEAQARKAEKDMTAEKRTERIQSQVMARAIERYRFTGVWDESLYGPLPAGVEVVS